MRNRTWDRQGNWKDVYAEMGVPDSYKEAEMARQRELEEKEIDALVEKELAGEKETAGSWREKQKSYSQQTVESYDKEQLLDLINGACKDCMVVELMAYCVDYAERKRH